MKKTQRKEQAIVQNRNCWKTRIAGMVIAAAGAADSSFLGTAGGRVFIEERNRRQRERGRLVTLDDEKRERRNATARAYLAKKRLDPEWVEKYREYRRNWTRKKRAEAKK